jgi:hypothetical protein
VLADNGKYECCAASSILKRLPLLSSVNLRVISAWRETIRSQMLLPLPFPYATSTGQKMFR